MSLLGIDVHDEQKIQTLQNGFVWNWGTPKFCWFIVIVPLKMLSWMIFLTPKLGRGPPLWPFWFWHGQATHEAVAKGPVGIQNPIPLIWCNIRYHQSRTRKWDLILNQLYSLYLGFQSWGSEITMITNSTHSFCQRISHRISLSTHRCPTP